MGLFGRRSRASSRASIAPPPQVPPTSAAAIAALAAAHSSQGPESTRLAAGAAAAALRSQTATPVDPGDVTTKRMLRRSSISSNTSNTSYQYGQGPTTRTRGASVGSMTSRSFRSPSPHGQAVRADPNAPPVPNLPRAISPSPSLMTKRTFRRPASTEPLPPRVTSPTPRKGARFASVDTSARKAAQPAPIRTSLDYIDETRNTNRNSVNFSRPMSPDNRPLSPSLDSPSSPTMRFRKQNGAPASPLTRGEAQQLEYNYGQVANEPVHRRNLSGGSEGSHLAAGTMGHRPTGTAVQDPPSRPMSPTQRARRTPLPRRISEEPDDAEEEFEEVFDPASRRMVKRRKPGYKPKPKPQQTPNPARVASPNFGASPARARLDAADRAAAQVPERPLAPTPGKAAQPVRPVSSSPARAARFSLQPETTPSKHEPSRSSSPRKSALKTSPSPRGPSPAGPPSNRLSWNQAGFNPSEASDNMSVTSDAPSKRRSMRVSFDDQPTIVGSASTPPTSQDSPTVLSPQDKKRSWFGMKKKQQGDESEEAYAPTPALPSFGSVRGKKDSPKVVQVGSQREAEEAAAAGMGVALTTGEKTPSEAGSALAPAAEPVSDAQHEKTAGEVPTIAVDPGTPAIDREMMEFASEPVEAPEPSSPVTASSPALVGIAEPEPEAAAAAHDPSTPTVGHVAESIIKKRDSNSHAAEEDSDDDSHYSDANEETGLDGDGFGSINAIVESPVLASKEPAAAKMAEALPPMTNAPPKELSPVAASEAEAGAPGRDTTTYREAVAQPDGTIVSNATTEASGAEKGTEKVEHTSNGAALVPTASVLAAPIADSNKTSNAATATTAAEPAAAATGPQSVSFNPRRTEDSATDAGPKMEDPKDWTQAQSYWADINARRKADATGSSENQPLAKSSPYAVLDRSPDGSHKDGSTSKAVENPTPQKKASVVDTPSQTPSRTGTPQRPDAQPKPLKSALKKTTSPTASPAATYRKSMPPGSAAAAAALTNTSMPEARSTLTKKNRPASMGVGAPAAQPSSHDQAVQLAQAIIKVQQNNAARESSVPAMHRRSGSYNSMHGQAPSKKAGFVPPMPKMRRRDSSGSDSSFRRAPSVTSEGGRVSMRRSMRANGGGRPQSMSMRGPPTIASTTTAGRPMSMRMDSGGAASLRQQRQPSPTRSLLGFKSNKKPSRASSVQAPRARASRFAADSDDEDTPGGAAPAPSRTYASRFEDSDDELGPLRPVRGIPKKSGFRQPSPDLDDSDSDIGTAATGNGTLGTGVTPATSATADDRLMELARQRLGIENRPTVPDAAASEAAHSPVGTRAYSQSDLIGAFAEKKAARQEATLTKRRSIFGGFGRKKRDAGGLVTKAGEDSSIARQGTPLGAGVNSVDSTPVSTPQRPTRVSRQNTMERARLVKENNDPDSWPLPESPTVAVRPNTADTSGNANGITAPRPPLGRSHFSADGVPLGRKGQKKRFMGLRKAFGLHD